MLHPPSSHVSATIVLLLACTITIASASSSADGGGEFKSEFFKVELLKGTDQPEQQTAVTRVSTILTSHFGINISTVVGEANDVFYSSGRDSWDDCTFRFIVKTPATLSAIHDLSQATNGNETALDIFNATEVTQVSNSNEEPSFKKLLFVLIAGASVLFTIIAIISLLAVFCMSKAHSNREVAAKKANYYDQVFSYEPPDPTSPGSGRGGGYSSNLKKPRTSSMKAPSIAMGLRNPSVISHNDDGGEEGRIDWDYSPPSRNKSPDAEETRLDHEIL